MKYLLLDGENVDVKGCNFCPLCDNRGVVDEDGSITEGLMECRHPDNRGSSEPQTTVDDHYMAGCPLSPYQSLHHLYVSAKCIYQTIKTMYDNFTRWWNERKK